MERELRSRAAELVIPHRPPEQPQLVSREHGFPAPDVLLHVHEQAEEAAKAAAVAAAEIEAEKDTSKAEDKE